MFVVDALVSGQAAGIGVVARMAMTGMAGRDDVLALVPPGVTPPVPHRPVRVASRRAGRLALQRSGGVLTAAATHLRSGARFVAMDAFSTPVGLPRTARAVVHDLLPFIEPRYWGAVDRRHKTSSCRTAFRRADRLVVSSEHNARLVRAVGGRGDAVVAPFGCGQLHDEDADQRLVAGPSAARDDRVVAVGTLEPRKRLDLLLRAMARLRAHGGDGLELVVVGDVDRRPQHAAQLRDLARDLELPVAWTGRLAWADVAPLVAGARAVVYPSRHEGFGLPLLEAMALGTRPVAPDVTAMRSWAGDWPRWFDPDDVDDLAAALLDVASDSDWDAGAAMRAVARHRWRRFADVLLAAP